MEKVKAFDYWNIILPSCFIELNKISKDFYYLITHNKLLQQYINEDIIKEYLSTENNVKWLMEDIFWERGINSNYISQSNDVSDLENIINELYNVNYVDCDDYVLIERKN